MNTSKSCLGDKLSNVSELGDQVKTVRSKKNVVTIKY
jgi:hypothetical protein